jgi:hypothetical protein
MSLLVFPRRWTRGQETFPCDTAVCRLFESSYTSIHQYYSVTFYHLQPVLVTSAFTTLLHLTVFHCAALVIYLTRSKKGTKITGICLDE